MNVEQLAVNTIKTLGMDAIQAANSGHPGMVMGMADIATVLWHDFVQYDPKDAEWPNRDRVVLSNGHGSMLLYSMLHLTGTSLSLANGVHPQPAIRSMDMLQGSKRQQGRLVKVLPMEWGWRWRNDFCVKNTAKI